MHQLRPCFYGRLFLRTQDIIRAQLKDIPGELFERPWKNFGHNRTEALELARGRADYAFVVDADEVLELPVDFSVPALSLDAYSLLIEYAGTNYWRMCLVAARLGWRFLGVLHEYLRLDVEFSQGRLEGPRVVCRMEGGRSKGIGTAEKYANDARTLQKALADEPDNSRYVFYLAQSYRDAGKLKNSLRTYQRRAAMGGWAEEVWYSLFEVAKLSERLKLPPATIVQRHLEAYEFRPQRAEPLVELARFYRERKQYVLAHLFAERAIRLARPDDTLFLDAATYEWRAIDEYAVASYWIGRHRDSADACEQLLKNSALPYEQLARVTENLNFALQALGAI
jgi:tetratricopeptide (TPR) repeat protein